MRTLVPVVLLVMVTGMVYAEQHTWIDRVEEGGRHRRAAAWNSRPTGASGWDAARAVTITAPAMSIVMIIDCPRRWSTAHRGSLMPPRVRNGATYILLRFVAEVSASSI